MMLAELSFRTFTPAESLLALLVSGHVLADFLVQTGHVAARKGRDARVLLLHAALTLLAHALLLLPFWSPALLAPLLALGGFHLVLDGVKGRLQPGSPGRHSLRAFLVDQALHAAGLVAVWAWLIARDVPLQPPVLLPASWLSPLAATSLVGAGLIFCGKGGTVVVRNLLARYPALVPGSDDPTGTRTAGGYEMGRTIGVLERLLVYLLVLAGQWGALGLVIAAKSIARFPEFRHQGFADYYLMGTLASILTAVAVGLAVALAVF